MPTNTRSAVNISEALDVLEDAAGQQTSELLVALSDKYTRLRKLITELWAVKEPGDTDIVIYGWFSNAWDEVGRVPLREIVREGAGRNVVHVRGLTQYGPCYFKIVNEVGHKCATEVPVTI